MDDRNLNTAEQNSACKIIFTFVNSQKLHFKEKETSSVKEYNTNSNLYEDIY